MVSGVVPPKSKAEVSDNYFGLLPGYSRNKPLDSRSVWGYCLQQSSQSLESFKVVVEQSRGNASQPWKCESALKMPPKPLWNEKLDSLMIQSKFRNIMDLESEYKVWDRVITSLFSGQLSLFLRTCSHR